MKGCKEEGVYKAPKSRDNLHEYLFFCLEHIREHNSKWDYFSGMDADQIEAFMQDAVTGHRPTWQRETTLKNPHEMLHAAVDEFLRGASTVKPKKPPVKLSAKMQKALALFELDYPYTLTNLKQRYKLLVKAYHPDRNQGDRVTEEKFKAVTVAFTLLKQHISG